MVADIWIIPTSAVSHRVVNFLSEDPEERKPTRKGASTTNLWTLIPLLTLSLDEETSKKRESVKERKVLIGGKVVVQKKEKDSDGDAEIELDLA